MFRYKKMQFGLGWKIQGLFSLQSQRNAYSPHHHYFLHHSTSSLYWAPSRCPVLSHAAFYVQPPCSDLTQDYDTQSLLPVYRWENWVVRRPIPFLKVTELGIWHNQNVFEPEASYGRKPLHFSPANLWCVKGPHVVLIVGKLQKKEGKVTDDTQPKYMGQWKNVSATTKLAEMSVERVLRNNKSWYFQGG